MSRDGSFAQVIEQLTGGLCEEFRLSRLETNEVKLYKTAECAQVLDLLKAATETKALVVAVSQSNDEQGLATGEAYIIESLRAVPQVEILLLSWEEDVCT